MFKNQLKIAWRSIKKQPFLNMLNTFGLAIGIAGTLLISLFIYDELSYDKMFADSDRIYRINVDSKFGGPAREFSQAAAPLAGAMYNDIPQVQEVLRFRPRGAMSLNRSDSKKMVVERNVTRVDSNFVSMFGLKLLEGDINSALSSPNTMILTKSAAQKHFGSSSALGQEILLDNNELNIVSGVIEDLPNNSFLADYTVFTSMVGYQDAMGAEWGSFNYNTFVKLKPNTNSEDIQQTLQGMVERYLIPYAQQFFPGITLEQFEASGNYVNYSTIKLTDMHLHSHRPQDLGRNGDIKSIYILLSIALFLILLASINFMNLSTAYSLKRAKEVGIRKTLGSDKRSLIRQFLTESGLITFGSLVLGLILAWIALPFFNDLADKDIAMPYSTPFFWGILLLGGLFLALFSGSYPAFFMSKFIPVKVLKGMGENSIGGGKIRSALVVFQFAVSIFLIVGTLVVSQQLRYIQNKDLGYSKDQVLVVNNVGRLESQALSFKNEVKRLGQIDNATLSSYLPTPSSRSDTSFFPEGNTNQEAAVNMQIWRVDFDYINTMKFNLISGRDFDSSIVTDSTATIINESALKVMGLTAEEVLGKRFTSTLPTDQPDFVTVVGVVKNFHFETMRDQVRPLSLRIANDPYRLVARLKSGNFEESIAQIKGIWDSMTPGLPFDYYFMDDAFNDVYQNERRLGSIFVIFSTLSIIIACLGLFGLAAFNAQKRIKEIGVRKVLGASVGQITYRLSIDFLKLVLISILLALPLGWLVMDRWLHDFSYRISIPWWVFVLAPLLAILVSLLTVSYQSIKAALVNPVKSLRTE